jgi:hypothetical protein
MTGPDRMDNLTCDDVRELAAAFVLGALDAAEEAAVREHLAGGHADAHPEVAELGSVVPAFFEAVPIVEPPAGLKDRILAAAAADLATGGAERESVAHAPATPTPAAPATPTPAAPAAPIAFPTADERAARRARTPAGTWLLRIAAVLVIGVLAGWNLLLQNDLGAARRYEQNVAAVLSTASQPGALTAVLSADGASGSGIAAVSPGGDVAMAMRDLAPTTGVSVYEAWVIAADGVPVPLGGFTVDSSRTAYFQGSGLPVTSGIVLALTLEAGPGATTPTLPIISKGVAVAPG